MKVTPKQIRKAHKMPEPKTAVTKAQQAKKLIEQAHSLIEEAKQEQLTVIAAAIGELRELGFTYDVVVVSQTHKTAPKTAKAPASGSKPSSPYDKNKSCSICKDGPGFVGHDGRAHRNQEPKKAFTERELKDKGLFPPEGSVFTPVS